MLTVSIAGDRELVAKLDRMPDAVATSIHNTVAELTDRLKARVLANLSGPVLQERSGALKDSIFSTVEDSGVETTGTVGSAGTPYAAILELGGQTSAHDIFPVKAQALAFLAGGEQVFAKVVHHPGSKIPARSYLGSSLEDMRGEIIASLTGAVAVATELF